jgi:uncharacterized caspase-like protein
LLACLAASHPVSADESDARGEVIRGLRSYPEYVDRWAVIVGISKYRDERLNLKYAHRDAQALYELLLKPSGGGFAADHVVKLIDEEATTAEVTRALRTFLKRPAKEDIVLLYFAAHGMPDPERPSNVYLLTHDTDPQDISGTALPMREVQAALRENLLAERVVLLADTCHSAAVGSQPGTRGGDSTAIVNRYLEEVSRTLPGMALMTSAEATEVALEDERWGEGHGVFTHYILQGMRGEADTDRRDGVVTVGELFDYVREQVKESTGNRQHPSIGQAPFDRQLPMAITGGATAHELLRVGAVLHELALKLDDRRRLESARDRFVEAARLARASGQSMPEAQVHLGRALLDLGEPEAAGEAFANALRQEAPNAVAADARFFLALTRIRQEQVEEARATFAEFVSLHADDDRAPSVREFLQQLSRPGARRALLIGVGRFGASENRASLPPLAGPANDVSLMRNLLSKHLGFGVTALVDADATRERILAELERLAQASAPADSVLVYYSGHGFEDNPIVPHDYPAARISAEELDRIFVTVPTRSKTLFLDTHGVSSLLWRARHSRAYALYMGSRPGEAARETRYHGDQYGVFTYHLAQELPRLPTTGLTHEALLSAVEGAMAASASPGEPRQQPTFAGNPNDPVFPEQPLLGFAREAFGVAYRRDWRGLDASAIQSEYELTSRVFPRPWSRLQYAVGRALLGKQRYAAAESALRDAPQWDEAAHPGATVAMAIAGIGQGKRVEGTAALRDALQRPTVRAALTAGPSHLQAALETIARGSGPRALLVGIGRYQNPDIAPNPAIAGNLELFRRLLEERFGFDPRDVTTIENEDATRERILNEIEALAARSRYLPAIFYFVGVGSSPRDEELAIVPYDGRQPGVSDVALSELSQRTEASPGLVSVFDTAFALHRDARAGPSPRGAILFQEYPVTVHTVGAVSLFPAGVLSPDGLSRSVTGRSELDTWGWKPRDFTRELAQALGEAEPGLTYAQLAARTPALFAKGATGREAILGWKDSAASLWDDLARALARSALEEAAALLERHIERRGGIYPEGFANLGVIYAERGDHERAIRSLETALAQGDAAVQRDARLQLGRVLYETRTDLGRAVDLLRMAHHQDSESAAAALYLGQAIRALVEQNLLQVAERALSGYVSLGAPYGQADEVSSFLESRRATSAGESR